MESEQQQTGSIIVEYDPIESGLAALREKFRKVPDATTKEGYYEVVEGLRTWRKGKKQLEDTRVILKAPALERSRAIDSEAKRIQKEMEDIFEPYAEARKEEDQRQADIKAELARVRAKRVSEIADRIDMIQRAPLTVISSSSISIKALIETLEATEITEELFGPGIDDGYVAKKSALATLRTMFTDKFEQEKEAVSQRMKQDAIDEENARVKAEQEATAKEHAEAQRKIDEENIRIELEQDERDKAQREAREKIDAENKRIAEEKAQVEADKQAVIDEKARIAREEAERKDEEARLKQEAEDMAEAAEVARVAREKAQVEARKEHNNRAIELFNFLLKEFENENEEVLTAFIDRVESGEVPYMKIDWTQK